MSGDILGPLTQAIFNFVWTKVLFTPGSSIYVPDIIQKGDPDRGFVSYDPYVAEDPLPTQPVDVAQATRDTACLNLSTPVIPRGEGMPTLSLLNIRIVNLHAMQPAGGLSFLPGYKVAAQVQLGSLGGAALPLTIETHDPKRFSFEFCQHCCVPLTPESPECQSRYDNQGHGTFTAKITRATLNLSITVDPTNITVSSIDELRATFDPKAVTFDFDVQEDGGDIGREAMLAMVKAAIQTGISNNLIQNQINALLDSGDLREHLCDMINQALAGVLPQLSAHQRPLTARD